MRFDEVIREHSRIRFVSQGDWFRLEKKGAAEHTQRTVSRDRIRTFDGEKTRVLDQEAAVGSISSTREEDYEFVRPHLLLIRYARLAVPFSAYLSNNTKLNPGVDTEVAYEGEEKLDGLTCHKVLVRRILSQSGVWHDGEHFWLAEDRNYLPVKLVAYTYRWSKDIPHGHGVVKELRQIKPGIWFPGDVEITSYNGFKIKQEGRQEFQWRQGFVIESAKLNAAYERSFFANLEFPKGTRMYERKEGKIIRSWREGDPEVPGDQKQSPP
jgi:hypothetical protein